MKQIVFLGNALGVIRSFPTAARRQAGHQLDRVQHGLDPTDWKPMPTVGPGVRELRIQTGGQFRVMYVTQLKDRVAVLHAFRKKTAKTSQLDLAAARKALKEFRRP